MKISLLIITYNNEDKIEALLKNVRKITPEIIVVDSGSSDKTVELAKRYTKKVFIHKFNNDYSTQKNYALSKATGDWILSLDSDELLSDELSNQIPLLVQNSRIDGYWFRRRNYISPNRYLKYGLFYPDNQLRLFRNKSSYHWEGNIHEKLTIPAVKTKLTFFDILHYQNEPKYNSFFNFKYFFHYINIDADKLNSQRTHLLRLVFYPPLLFILLFYSGYIRGKGFLDGWAGFRSHLLFALYSTSGYYYAIWKRIKKYL